MHVQYDSNGMIHVPMRPHVRGRSETQPRRPSLVWLGNHAIIRQSTPLPQVRVVAPTDSNLNYISNHPAYSVPSIYLHHGRACSTLSASDALNPSAARLLTCDIIPAQKALLHCKLPPERARVSPCASLQGNGRSFLRTGCSLVGHGEAQGQGQGYTTVCICFKARKVLSIGQQISVQRL